ncbi:hypothetical protein RB653_005752 [Dictyostelium firmibasis]|uniref:Uncharacterized protein n=1 Tax=Dictyostelium firmibasis TaxID=79012 RepID=A0AAN7UD78_9MYCE
MKLKLFSLLLLFSLFLFNINLSKSETFILYADKCTNLGCAFSSLFSSAPSILDDVIVKTNNSAIQAILTMTNSMSIKSLNISNGILKVAAGGSLTVANNILVQVGSSLSIDGTSTCNSLILNGGGSINLGGTLNVNTQISCDGSVNGGSIQINGTLNVKSLNFFSNSPIPTIYQNGVLNLNGDANFSTGLTLRDNSQINIKSGICTIDGLLTTTTNSIIHIFSTLNIINSVVSNNNITCGIKFDTNSVTNLIGSKCSIYNIAMIAPTSTINLKASASLSIFNQNSLVTFGPINVDATSSLTLENSNCLISKSLSIVKGSLINLKSNTTLSIGVAIDLLNDFTIDVGSTLVLASGSTNSLSGSVKCSIGSIIKIVNSIVNFNSPIVIDTLLIDKSTSTFVKIVSNVTINNGIECIAPLSQISIDPVIGSLNIGGNSMITNVLNLSGNSQFNIINRGVCVISRLLPIEQSMVNVFQGGNLTITTATNLTNCLGLHGDSSLQLNANAIINGLTVYPVNQLNLPIINLKNSICNLMGSIDQLGTINLIKSSQLTLGDKVVLNVNNNLIVDSSSSIILPVNSNLIIGGPNSMISSLLSIDGKLNIESGSITFNAGINSSTSSFLFCNNAKVSIGASSNFNGPFSVTGSSGSIAITDGDVHFHQGIQIPTTKCPFNILKSSTCHIHSASVISSPVYCLNDATLNIVSAVSSATSNVVQFEGGLFTDINAMVSIDNSIFSLNSTSSISGMVMLNESQLVSCGQTTFNNGIDSIIQGEGNNTLLVNSGSCLINTTNPIQLSGSINIMEKAFLSIRSPNTTCHKGIKNSGSLLIGAIVDLKNSMINQLNGDATLELLQGSNLITTGANFASGIVSGSGKITITKPTIINNNNTKNSSESSESPSNSSGQCENGGILSGWITIDGSLKLLESSVLRVNVVSRTNVSKIICTGSTIINGLIDVLFDTETVEETLTKGMVFPVLSSSISITGNLSLSDTLDSKQFSCKPPPPSTSSTTSTSKSTSTGSEYSLVYQQTNVPSNKVTSTENSTNSSTSIINSFSFYLLLISLLISLIYL